MSRLIIGAMVRTLGAYPSGWRVPGAHRDPRGDAAALRRTAEIAEAARLDYLFFGDWLATGPELEHRDPHLVARIDPLSAVSYLAAVTSRIGLIATANTTYADPYALARATASIDLLSGGRAGLNLVAAADPDADANHGRDVREPADRRYDRAGEFETVLRRLWDSFEDDAIVADAETGRYLDPAGLHPTRFQGAHVRVAGPLNVIRPVQGHLPIVHSGTSPRARLFAARSADVALVAVPGIGRAIELREELRALAFEAGRDDRTLKVIVPVLPVVGQTRAHAQAIADRLTELVAVGEDWADAPPRAFPAERSLGHLAGLVGVGLDGFRPDDPVPPGLAAAFSTLGLELAALVAERTGRVLGGDRPPTFRHLVVTATVHASMIVGTPADIAAEFAAWGDAGAVDGFNVLSATQPAQFEAFATGVIPELQRLGVFPTEYEGATLRDHLGLERPANVHAASRALVD
ncbi:NtaA/DmoA family FMN-dependent monooxygenase [Agromyces aerolatus]|uniref:NtaA/DmoA family FMN-dependent monooxygenase n=1 Tax=Agromyces sp. LY-1074 TaxID=3074080 RepID=UPI00286086E7|nr:MULTISPECIES: NtaA/DmoA family FMN-dependent monooxygenase [unclassified Agromyces]MDR5701376.1 NtaA/DmoA family FMN-dependent monooxygenase [Agromyces sp. LY-1074]MDR5706835.1 NtaA/DmoA family FMN-dependent monooxygenase [Agromyces sp. LY-1358]